MVLRTFILSLMLAGFASLHAQETVKSTQNTPLANIDYKQKDAPMPGLLFLAYHDSTGGTDKVTLNKKGKIKKHKKQSELHEQNRGSFYQVTDKELNNGANLFVMMFNPTCLHCEDATFKIEDNIKLFKKSKIVLLTGEKSKMYIPDFAQRHRIVRYPAMYIGYDSSTFIDDVFLYQTLPQLNIYNAERKLIKVYCGDVPIDTLKKFIQ